MGIKIKFKKNLKKLCLTVFSALAIVFLLNGNNVVNANYQSFLEQLKLMDITVEDIQIQPSISRYELTRLLNAVECNDCINQADRMSLEYNNIFWNNFSNLPGKDFDDIDYLGGVYNEQSYYYCVAYVGDNGYMRGYPADISPVCAGQFCGQRNVTKAEFIQVLVNLLAQYIYADYRADWDNILDWMEGLDPDSSAYKYLDDTDREIISFQANLCEEESCEIDGVNNLKSYIKYCMYNLDACEMQEFGIAVEGYRPVAELNILFQQQIIDAQEASAGDINDTVDGQKVLEILYKINDFIGCSFDNDYDCDGMTNAFDSCPNTYSPNQTDTDGDGIGDVCDGDIDNDGVANPVGIVDDLGRIDISVAEVGMDNCLFEVNPNQEIDDEQFIGVACSSLMDKVGAYIDVENIENNNGLTVDMNLVTRGTVENITRKFGDQTTAEGREITHQYLIPGIYTVSAYAEGPNNTAIARTTVIVGGDFEENRAMQIRTDKIGVNGNASIRFSALNAGDIDKITRDMGDGTELEKTPLASFEKVYTNPGEYSVKAKARKGNELVAIGVVNVAIGFGNKGSKLEANKIMPNIDEEIEFETEIYGFREGDIQQIIWDFGDGEERTNNSLTMSHSYKNMGNKVIVQKISLKNGAWLNNAISIFVNDPKLMNNHSLTMKPSRLWARRGQGINLEITDEGDRLQTIIALNYWFLNNNINRIFENPGFPFTTENFEYNQEGIYIPKTSIVLNECQTLESQATVVVHGLDSCLESLLQGNLGTYQCDMDADGIPDVCDDDIDGDGITNLVGIINSENADCSITADNIDFSVLDKHLNGVCSLDNCPFDANNEQFDLNLNEIGDSCEYLGDIVSDAGRNTNGNDDDYVLDSDNDGIGDTADACPDIPENYNGIEDLDGCPEIAMENSCNYPGSPYYSSDEYETSQTCDDIICPGVCDSCPCQYTDFINDLVAGDQVRARLFDWTKLREYSVSITEEILPTDEITTAINDDLADVAEGR